MSAKVNLTYINCKKLIEMRRYKNEKKKEDIMNKFDEFLLNDRITQTEFGELVGLVNI